jgi:hypothetical protein
VRHAVGEHSKNVHYIYDVTELGAHIITYGVHDVYPLKDAQCAVNVNFLETVIVTQAFLLLIRRAQEKKNSLELAFELLNFCKNLLHYMSVS